MLSLCSRDLNRLWVIQKQTLSSQALKTRVQLTPEQHGLEWCRSVGGFLFCFVFRFFRFSIQWALPIRRLLIYRFNQLQVKTVFSHSQLRIPSHGKYCFQRAVCGICGCQELTVESKVLTHGFSTTRLGGSYPCMLQGPTVIACGYLRGVHSETGGCPEEVPWTFISDWVLN